MATDAKIRPLEPDWVPPANPEVQVVERDGVYLCLNPRVPAWFGTTKAGSLLLDLVDGERSVADIGRLLADNEVALSGEELRAFFAAARGRKFFDPVDDIEPRAQWGDHKLEALYLHLTDRCNLQCSYCYRESSPRIPIRHGAERFSQLLTDTQPFAGPGMTVTFSGGEPLTYPGFEEVVCTSSSLGYANSLLTNGTLITPQRAVFIREHFKFVKISLDGPSEEVHSRTRGKGNFAKVIRGIRRVAETGIEVRVQVTLSMENLPHADAVHRLFEDLPNLMLRFTPMFPMGRGAGGEGDFVGSDLFHRFSSFQARTKGKGLNLRRVAGRRSRACHAGGGSLSVADTGDVYPCHLFHQARYLLGNVFEDSVEQVLYGERARRFVRSMDVERNNPTCKACEVRFLCSGGCHANTLFATGDHRGPDSFCSYLKKTIYDDLFTLIGHPGEPPESRPGLPVVR